MKESVVLLTKRGMKKLRKTLSKLERERKAIARSLREARRAVTRDMTMSDLRARLAYIDTKMQEIRDVLRKAQLAKPISNEAVTVGSVVDLRDTKGNGVRYQVVDTLEADPSQGKVSSESPLGKALIGRRVNDKIVAAMGRAFRPYHLVAISH